MHFIREHDGMTVLQDSDLWNSWQLIEIHSVSRLIQGKENMDLHNIGKNTLELNLHVILPQYQGFHAGQKEFM